MSTRIPDVEDRRVLTIDGRNKKNPESVFITGPRGMCMEFDKRKFVDAVLHEFRSQLTQNLQQLAA